MESDKDITFVLANVASSVVGQFDMEALLNQIIESTMKTLNAEVCSIFVEDKEDNPGVLKCVAGSGFAQKIVGKAKYKIGEGFTGSVAKYGGEYNIKSRHELKNLEINGQKVWKGKFDKKQWESGENEFRNAIGLPLKIKDQTLGVIKVENKIDGDCFSDQDLVNFKTIANVIALTIENVRLHQKAEEQSKTISSALADVAKAVVGQFDMHALLNQIINITMETLHAEVCSIFLEDKENEPGVITCKAGSGFAEKIVGKAKYYSGEGLTGAVFKYGFEYNSKNRREHERLKVHENHVWKGKFDDLQWKSGKSEFKNGIGLPLKIKDEILGVIKVENKISRYGNFFTDEDLTIFRTIANVIALTIENVRLHQKAEDQSKTISSALADVAKAVVGKFDMQALLNQIINTTMETLHAEVCSIFLEDKDDEPGVLRCVAGSGHAKNIVESAIYKSGEGLTGAVFEYGEEYNTKSRKELENLKIGGMKVWKGKFDPNQWPSGKSEFRNGIGLTLRIKEEKLGVIKVENKLQTYGEYFTEDDMRTFKTIANVIAIAIENARLHQKIETQLKTIAVKAAHRINNQLTNYDAIEIDLIEQSQLPIVDKQKINEIQSRVYETTTNLKRMVGEFKNYGKPLVIKKEFSDINKIIENEIWLAKPPTNIIIEKKLSQSLSPIKIDAGRFAEAIKELLSNSIKALSKDIRQNKSIFISTDLVQFECNCDGNDSLSRSVLILISDNGPGFPTNFPYFEPFQSTDPQSTGLGLVTVRELVEAHQGRIDIQCEPNSGTKITISIPY